MKRPGFRTYVTSRPFGGFVIPVAVQNVFLRNYAAQNGLTYMLPVNEFMFENCFIQLEAALKEMEEIEGLLMCSLFMLPSDFARRSRVFERVYATGSEMHFAMEQLALRKPGDESVVDEIFEVHRVLADCPRSIPTEELPPMKHSTVL